jgi:hypothetical protein
MTDITEEARPDDGPEPAPQPEKDPASAPAPPEATEQPDPPVEASEAEGQNADQDSEAALTAADLAESIKVSRRIRHAGLESLGGTWFGGAARFTGPASIGGGHAAARDVNIFYGSAGPMAMKSGPVDHEVVRRVRLVHVASRSYAEAETLLRRERLVVLRGADGSGKRTTALFMLDELTCGDIRAVDADLALRTPDGSELPEGAGYLAISRTPQDLTYSHLAAWASELERRQAYLIVTVPAGTSADADTIDRFFVDHEPPDCHEVVRNHLRHDPVHVEEASRLLEDDAVLACATTPEAAAALATALLQIASNERPPDDLEPVLRGIRRRRAQHLLRVDRPKRPRDRVELLCRRAALVSVAVFTGLPYADAVAAAETLAAAFIAIEFPRHDDAGRELFIPWSELLTAEPDMSIEEADLHGRWGPATTQQLRFRDPELHVAMLEEVWEHYSSARSPLLDWLRYLATSQHGEAVCVRAAQVIGRLATRDFDHVCHRVILDWADSINTRAREAAAIALEAAAVSMAPHIWELLSEWCSDGTVHRQRTAVLALGTTISEHEPNKALDRLRQVALRGSGRSAELNNRAVRRSVTELFSGPHTQAVLRALRAWVMDADARMVALARRCVPPLAHMADDFGRPSLLVAVTDNPSLRADVAALFATVLEEQGTRKEAWTALEKLATAATPHPRLIDALGQLLADLQRLSPIAATQMLFYLRLWVQRNPGLAA